MSYTLIRGREYITTALPPKTTKSIKRAYTAQTIDEAIDYQSLIRMAFGLSTEIRPVVQ